MSHQIEIERLQTIIDNQKTVIQALQRENTQLTAQLEVYAAQSRKLIEMANRLQAQSTAALEQQLARMRYIEACLLEAGTMTQGVCTLVDAPDPLLLRASASPEDVRRVLKAALPDILALLGEAPSREAPPMCL